MMLLTAILSVLIGFGALQTSTSTQPAGAIQGGAILTGRVLDPSGQPMRDLRVTAYSKRLSANGRPTPSPVPGQPMLFSSGQAQTNTLGEFRVNVRSAGEYLLAVEPPNDFRRAAIAPGSVALATVFPNTNDASRAQPITARDGETVADLIIRVVSAPAFQLSGVVVDETGAAFANVVVSLAGVPAGTYPFLTSSIGSTHGDTAPDATGRFSFSAVPAGVYMLIATEISRSMSTRIDMVVGADGIPRARPQPGSAEATITDANVDSVRIVLPRPR